MMKFSILLFSWSRYLNSLCSLLISFCIFLQSSCLWRRCRVLISISWLSSALSSANLLPSFFSKAIFYCSSLLWISRSRISFNLLLHSSRLAEHNSSRCSSCFFSLFRTCLTFSLSWFSFSSSVLRWTTPLLTMSLPLPRRIGSSRSFMNIY